MQINYSVIGHPDLDATNIDDFLRDITGKDPYAKSFPAWDFNPLVGILTIRVTRAKTHGAIADLLDESLKRI